MSKNGGFLNKLMGMIGSDKEGDYGHWNDDLGRFTALNPREPAEKMILEVQIGSERKFEESRRRYRAQVDEMLRRNKDSDDDSHVEYIDW